MDALTAAKEGETVTVRGRVHAVRSKGKSAFLVLRGERAATVQLVLFADDGATVSKTMVKYAAGLTKESIVDVVGTVVVPPEPIQTCTQSGVELKVTGIRCLSRADVLPFELVDAARSEADIAAAEARGEVMARVGAALRLDKRHLDLRAPAMQAVFRLQGHVGRLFRHHLDERGFCEIHSPKLIAGSSEGGAEVFRVDYLGRPACLAQSPQLYKQLAVCADFARVYEVGPVFRAERSDTHRHLTEARAPPRPVPLPGSRAPMAPSPSHPDALLLPLPQFVGLDLEMTIRDHYEEVVDVLEGLFVALFDGLGRATADPMSSDAGRAAADAASSAAAAAAAGLPAPGTLPLLVDAVRAQFTDLTPLVYKPAGQNPRIPFPEAVAMLRAAGHEHGDLDDFTTVKERALGKLVLEKYGSELFFVTRFPSALRPFYTMPERAGAPVRASAAGGPADDASGGDPRYSCSFDVFVRGEEIVSGAQRVHEPAMLEEQARAKDMDPSDDGLRGYIDGFRLGAPPHGGAGVGLERVLMLYLGLDNIRKASLFPRDPSRLTP